ncbi:MAG: BatD family protein [Elusimicrobia bacterium]|nr:BatD family protein [Elusimicrobiota bacterium]
MKITTIFLAIFFSLPVLTKAEMKLSASVDKETVAINDTIRLTITIQSSNSVKDPVIPAMKDFNIYSSGQSQNISFINGKFSYSLNFSYVLTPKTLGKAQIPSITVFEGNKQRFTSPIDIEVIKPNANTSANSPAPSTTASAGSLSSIGEKGGSKAAKTRQTINETGASAPKTDKLIFLTAEVNKKSAYVNEQINLSLKFYTALPLINNPQYSPPKLEGFISEDLPPIGNGQVAIDGRLYYYNEIKTALFPMDEGVGIINPAIINAQIQSSRPSADPFDSNFFQHFFSGIRQGENKQVESPRLKVKLLPLPEKGKPDSFNGAVGNYKISAMFEKTEVKAGETINLLLTISGEGNLKTITMPALPEMPNFKIYDTVTSLSMNKTNDIIGGKKVFTNIMMPRISGEYEIKPIKFSFFNPKTKIYNEIETKPLKIKVAKNGAIPPAIDYYQNSTGEYSQIKTISSDIHYILENKRTPSSVKLSRKLASALWLNFAFLLILLASVLFAYINGLRTKNPDMLKSKKAYKKSLKEMSLAANLAREEKYPNAVLLLHNSLNAYLSAKLRNNIGSLTIRKVITEIKQKNPNIESKFTEELKTFSDELEMLRFAPTSINKEKIDTLILKYKEILKFFEKEFKQ